MGLAVGTTKSDATKFRCKGVAFLSIALGKMLETSKCINKRLKIGISSSFFSTSILFLMK